MDKILYCVFLLLTSSFLQAKEYHVSPAGSDVSNGSLKTPFKTINAAAQKALPGDTVTVHNGVYREWVNPLNGGESNDKRIIYRVADGEKAELKGSEQINTWKRDARAKGVWTVTLPNHFFGNYNPYSEKISGDWFNDHGRAHHTGDVYLNDVSLYETTGIEGVLAPDTIRSARDPNGTTLVWFAVVDSAHTTIYANFGQSNPNKERVEIAVRPTCFYPTRQGLNFITIQGFHISQAATQWGAPTAEQVGMVGTHWCKGWIIENNRIKNSRCNGISLGKERSTGHNVASVDTRLDGTLHYLEVIFNTIRHGWNDENIGSHIVRYNVISDCEQTGICGSMGGAFSEIYGNEIYNIWSKRQFSGAEMSGIKLHGAIDTYIHHNRIYKCGYAAIWLDWMAQGVRVSSNLFYDNMEEDLFIEVDHGPYIIDNNFLLSKRSILEYSDGGAFVHNLFAGNIECGDEPNRYTPYQLSHSTEVKGISIITNGDHRFYNNIFVGGTQEGVRYGLQVYNSVKWPLYAMDNVFCNGAQPLSDSREIVMDNYHPDWKLEETKEGLYLSFTLKENILPQLKVKPVDTPRLGKTRLSNYPYENADGTSLSLNRDFFGMERPKDEWTAGPIESSLIHRQRIKVW